MHTSPFTSRSAFTRTQRALAASHLQKWQHGIGDIPDRRHRSERLYMSCIAFGGFPWQKDGLHVPKLT